MEVTLKPEVEKLIEEDIKAGRSATRDDFLDKAVYHYIVARDLGEDYSREEVEEKISHALAQADRGESINGEEAFRRLRAHADARARELR